MNFYSPWIHEKTYGFLVISEGIQDNWFTCSRSEFLRPSLTDTDLFSSIVTSESNLNIHFFLAWLHQGNWDMITDLCMFWFMVTVWSHLLEIKTM